MPNNETPKWRDIYTTLAPEDHEQLEANAAIREFRGGLPKEQAESKAYEDYLKNHAIDAAAHHYIGVRAAMAAGHISAAKKHGQAYNAAISHLGLNVLDAPPKEVLDRVKDIDKNPYQFKAHQADNFFTPQPEEKKPTEKERTLELIEKLKSQRLKPVT